MRPVGVTKKGKKDKNFCASNWLFAQTTLVDIGPWNFCVRGCVREVVIYFKFHENRFRGLGAVGGRKSPSPIDKAHGLKPWYTYFEKANTSSNISTKQRSAGIIFALDFDAILVNPSDSQPDRFEKMLRINFSRTSHRGYRLAKGRKPFDHATVNEWHRYVKKSNYFIVRDQRAGLLSLPHLGNFCRTATFTTSAFTS